MNGIIEIGELDKKIRDVVQLVLQENKESVNFVLTDVFNEYLQYSELNKQQSTIENDMAMYRLHIIPHFGSCKILDIKPKDIIQWHSCLNKYLSYQSIVNVHKGLSKLFNWADKVYDTKWNPTTKIGVPKRKEKKEEMLIWSEYDFFKFYSVVANLEHKIIFLLLYFAGLRRGELLALRWNDLINNHIRVDESVANIKGKQVVKEPKNFNSYRLVEMSEPIIVIINEFHDIQKLDVLYHPENFIIGRRTRPMAFETLRKTKLRYEEKSKSVHITLHDMRHSHVSLLINNHMPVIAIAQRIGDTIEEVLQTYSHLLPQSSLEIALFLNKVTEKYQ